MRQLYEWMHDEVDHLLWKYGDDIFWIGLIIFVMLLFSGYGYSEWHDERLQMQEEESYNM